MFGGSHLASDLDHGNSFIGYGGFMLIDETYDVKTILLFVFMAVVATFIGSIIAGSVAERIKFSAFLVLYFLVYLLDYSFYDHWIWGEGWLAKLELGVGGLIRGSSQQFLAQLIAFGTAIVWAGGLGFAIFFWLKHSIGIRMTETEELNGLDVIFHDTQCYPPDGKHIRGYR